MDTTIEQYGAGAGLVFGVGIGGVVGTLAELDASLALVAGFGAGGGLVVGALAGQFVATRSRRSNWVRTVTAFTLGVSLIVGTLLGATGAWMVDAVLSTGAVVGAASGIVFGGLLTAALVRAVTTDGSSDALGLDW
ncbi:MAG: hypothetical protein U5K70_09790 [Halodesulfurarchaeum sp.]|nr:hypothetical protein [Halodesulfurarchaeum sp.]